LNTYPAAISRENVGRAGTSIGRTRRAVATSEHSRRARGRDDSHKSQYVNIIISSH
jgi:hypothetical protein